MTKQVETLTKKVAEMEKANANLKPIVADFADIDKNVVEVIKKKTPELMKEIIQKELADFVWETKLNVQNMKNEQVNQIKSGVIKELKEIFSKSMERERDEIVH